jgi:hypothetical protein
MKLAVAFLLGLGPLTGHSQVQSYYYSGPVNGLLQVGLNPADTQDGYAGFNVSFSTLTETLNYDPVAQTLEEAGTVNLNAPSSSGTFNLFSDPEGINGTRSVVGTAALTAGINGIFSFDSTFSLSAFNQPFQGISMPVSGTAIYQGQELAGSWDLLIPAFPTVVAATPTSLTFTEGGGGPYLLPGPLAMPGLIGGDANDTYYASWYVSGVATAVPEPETESLLVFTAAIFSSWIMSRHFRKKLRSF